MVGLVSCQQSVKGLVIGDARLGLLSNTQDKIINGVINELSGGLLGCFAVADSSAIDALYFELFPRSLSSGGSSRRHEEDGIGRFQGCCAGAWRGIRGTDPGSPLEAKVDSWSRATLFVEHGEVTESSAKGAPDLSAVDALDGRSAGWSGAAADLTEDVTG